MYRAYLRKPNQIRVALVPVGKICNNELLVPWIDIHIFASFKSEVREKFGKLLFIFLTIGKPASDFFHRRAAVLAKEGRFRLCAPKLTYRDLFSAFPVEYVFSFGKPVLSSKYAYCLPQHI